MNIRKKYQMAATPRSMARTPLSLGETSVESNLAYTPGDIQRMAQKGISINSMNMEGSYYYEAQSRSWDIPISERRGIDPADIWNAQMDARSKLRSADKKARAQKLAETQAQ